MHRTRFDAGAAAVEFAIVSVLLLTLVFGTLQYGYFFFQATAVEHGAREAARLASVGITSCPAYAHTVAARAGSADVTGVSATFSDTSPDPVDGVVQRGDTVEVVVTWAPSDFQLPFVPFVGSGPYAEKATTRIERTGGAVPVDCVVDDLP